MEVVAFNTAEGWSRDVSEEIADELAQSFAQKRTRTFPASLKDFMEGHGSRRPEQPPLPLRGTA